MSEFKMNLNKARKKMGISQLELADKIGVNNNTISAWESGKAFPSWATIEKIAAGLKIDPYELVKEEKGVPDPTPTVNNRDLHSIINLLNKLVANLEERIDDKNKIIESQQKTIALLERHVDLNK